MDKPDNISQVMAWVGRHTSPAKAAAARGNGKRGGRPVDPDSARQKKLAKKPLTEPNG